MPRYAQDSRTFRQRTLAGTAFACGLALGAVHAQTSTLPSTGTIAIPTYEAAGLTWQSPGGTAGCEVKYRKSTDSSWSQGLPMSYDARDGQCRGSLVHLTPSTSYQVEFNLPGQAASRGLVFTTWANQFPVAKTITVNGGNATYDITEGGSAGGYVVYQGAQGAVLDGQNSAQYNITVNASHVIIRGLTLKGARQDAIRISPNVKDVVIEDNDISGWGRTRDGKWGADMDSAVRAVCTSPSLERVTIQRNRIHDPRYSANSWSDGHPAGPQAITFSHCGGNHVIRHNDVYSTNGNYFNDIIGGEDNFTLNGFPNSDTDIYGNKLSHAWDDGIEAEGANENVRIWGNYIDRTAIGIATTATSVGPAYIFRNVWNRAQMYQKVSLDQDDRQPFFKSGSSSSLGYGRRYFFHNTMLQAVQSGLAYTLGGGYGMGGTGSTQLIQNTHSKNNIYHLWKPKSAFYQTGTTNEIMNDMYNGTAGDASIVNGINAAPTYAAGHGWQSEAGGNYQLASGSPGYDRGARIPNFNDGFTGAAPDVGAHEGATASMKFGIAASPGSAVGGAGTTEPTDPTPTDPTPTEPTPTPTTGGVTASPASLTFGTTQSTQTVTFTNNTSTKVTFIQASMSSTKFGQTNNCGEVAAGASCTASVTYYPSNSGSTSGTYTLTSTAPDSPHVVTLTGGGTTTTEPTPHPRPAMNGVSASASALTFGTTQGTQAVTFTNNTPKKVTFIQASMSSSRFGQTNNCGEVLPGKSCTASITYYPNYSGSTTGTFTLTSTAPNSPHVVSLAAGGQSSTTTTTTTATSNPLARGSGLHTIRTQGFTSTSTTPTATAAATGQVNLSATSLLFTSPGMMRTVTYTNNTPSRVTFIRASVTSAKFGQANNCGEVAPGGSCTATVTYYPTNAGSTTATLTLTSTAPNSPHVVSLSAY